MLNPKLYPITAEVLLASEDEDATYRIVRMYKEGHPPKTMKEGLSLEEAKEWCRDPETSSRKCEEPENVKHTEEMGDWFDGFEAE